MAFAILMLKEGEAIEIFPKVEVKITNQLNSKEGLTLHCKAKHDDLREYTIKYGDHFIFGFEPNPFLLVSLYFCSFRWPSDENLHYINIYDERRDMCLECDWIVKEGGPCTYDSDTGTFDICYAWKSTPEPSSALDGSNITNANSTMEVLLATTMVFAISSGGGEAGIIPSEVSVQIINTLDSHEDLICHCKSKEDDLGEHTITYPNFYSFKFRPNVLVESTLFFCSFRWPSNQTLHYINIYNQGRDDCTTCYWNIRERDACTYDYATPTVPTCYSWHKN
ncbi:S-protein-like protein 5-like [Senna tora]|uniref:S-protein homolog n=1 Tax=Senna tora TaxID=362788 RepID=A0A834SLX7_9FABA|nr:S-protein-like protein 5-like [Senna tora]